MNEAVTGAAIGVAKQADSLTDRGLFLLALVILGTFGVWVVKKLNDRDERKSELLVGLFKEANEGRLEVAKTLTSCAVIMERCQATMDLCGRTLERTAEYFEEQRRERREERKTDK